MKLSGYRQLIKEDVEEQYRPLIEKIGYSLNNFATEVIKAFDGNITIDDNLNEAKKDLTVTVNSSGIPTTTTSLKTGLKTSCAGIQVIRATNLTNSITYPTSAPFITYTETNGVITINHIAGLPANNQFKLKVRLTG